MTPDIKAIEERRKRLYKSDADNVYVEDYLADTEFLLNRINDLTAQLKEAKADYEAAVEDLRDALNGKLLHCVLCAHFKDDDVCGQKCESWEDWTYRRKGNG